MGTQLPLKKGHSPKFSTHVCCGQTAGWIKMPLGTGVGLGPRDIVLDWNPPPPPPKKRHSTPHFSAHVSCGRTAGWIRITLGTEVGHGSGDVVLDGDRAPPTERGTAAPTFRPMSIVAKWSPISATAELLYYYLLKWVIQLKSLKVTLTTEEILCSRLPYGLLIVRRDTIICLRKGISPRRGQYADINI